ncbi:MAG: TolC family protein, partial [Planctomycetota bacterium]
MTRMRRFTSLCLVVSGLGLGSRVAASPPTVPEPTGPLHLEDALALALRHHPGFAADAWELRAREADLEQADRGPNPELELELENFGGSGSTRGLESLEMTLAFSRTLELGGKRAKRTEEARRVRDGAALDAEIRRVDRMADVVAAFVGVLAAQQRVALADSLAALADDVLVSVGRRVRAGGVSPVEERRARVSRETAVVEKDRAGTDLFAARTRLAASWGGLPQF